MKTPDVEYTIAIVVFVMHIQYLKLRLTHTLQIHCKWVGFFHVCVYYGLGPIPSKHRTMLSSLFRALL